MNGEVVSFTVGNIQIGEVKGKEIITPIDFVENGDLNNQKVRNIASFIQSLDSDSSPENGITISLETKNALTDKNLDFTSDNFYLDLNNLLNELNVLNSSSLSVVSANDAAQHLAITLEKSNEFEILPRVLQGRQWENGNYFRYNTEGGIPGEYLFKVGNNLDGVRYNFGENRGYYLNMNYVQDTLIGNGNFYNDINNDPPVDSVYEYFNRITSPGIVFDYGGDTFIGYYNYYKVEGEPGKLQGKYLSFLIFKNKVKDQDPITSLDKTEEIIIGDPNNDGNFPITYKSYDNLNDRILNEESKSLKKEYVDNEKVLLIQFQNKDYLFISQDISDDASSYIFPQLFAIKQ